MTTNEPGKIIPIDKHFIQSQLKEVVRDTVEETLNSLLDAEADRLCGEERYERTETRKETCTSHYKKNIDTAVGRVELKMPKLRNLPFGTAIVEQNKRREASLKESLIEMYLAGVSDHRVEDIIETL